MTKSALNLPATIISDPMKLARNEVSLVFRTVLGGYSISTSRSTGLEIPEKKLAICKCKCPMINLFGATVKQEMNNVVQYENCNNSFHTCCQEKRNYTRFYIPERAYLCR